MTRFGVWTVDWHSCSFIASVICSILWLAVDDESLTCGFGLTLGLFFDECFEMGFEGELNLLLACGFRIFGFKLVYEIFVWLFFWAVLGMTGLLGRTRSGVFGSRFSGSRVFGSRHLSLVGTMVRRHPWPYFGTMCWIRGNGWLCNMPGTFLLRWLDLRICTLARYCGGWETWTRASGRV